MPSLTIISISGQRVDVFFFVGFEKVKRRSAIFFAMWELSCRTFLIDLEIRAGDVERDIGAVDRAAEDHQIVGEDVFAIVGDEDAVAEELDRAFFANRNGGGFLGNRGSL